MRSVRAKRDRSSQALNTRSQREDAAFPLVAVRGLSGPVGFGEYAVLGRCWSVAVCWRDLLTFLLRDDEGKTGGGSQSNTSAGRRRRRGESTGTEVLRLPPEASKDTVGGGHGFLVRDACPLQAGKLHRTSRRNVWRALPPNKTAGAAAGWDKDCFGARGMDV